MTDPQVVATDIQVDIPALVNGINASTPAETRVVDGLLVGEYAKQDGHRTLFLVLVAEYAGARVTFPRALAEPLVRQLEQAGRN